MRRFRLIFLCAVCVLTQGCAWIAKHEAESLFRDGSVIAEKIGFGLASELAEIKVAQENGLCDLGYSRACDIEQSSPVSGIPAGIDVSASVGGKGEGLSCSIPESVAKLLFPDPPATVQLRAARATSKITEAVATARLRGWRSSPINLRFKQACNFHDFCYRHGFATYGYTRGDCDTELFDNAFRTCALVYRPDSPEAVTHCKQEAALVHAGVRWFGDHAFRGFGESTFFEFDPLARPYRDAISVARVLRTNSHKRAIEIWQAGHRRSWGRYRFDTTALNELGSARSMHLANPPSSSMPPPLHASGFGWLRDEHEYVWVHRGNKRHTEWIVHATTQFDPTAVSAQIFDCNTPAVAMNRHMLTLFSFGPGADTLGDGRCKLGRVNGQHLHFPRLVVTKEFADSNHYRGLQHEPLFGRFTGTVPQVLLLLRGFHPDDQGRTHQGVGWAQGGVLSIRALTSDSLDRSTSIKKTFPDTAEPYAVLRSAATADPDILIGFERMPKHAKGGEILIREISASSTSGNESRPLSLSGDWLSMPVQLVGSDTTGDKIVFSRVTMRQGGAAADEVAWSSARTAGRFDGTVRLEVKVYERATTEYIESASGQREVNLDQSVASALMHMGLTPTLFADKDEPLGGRLETWRGRKVALSDLAESARNCRDGDEKGCGRARLIAAGFFLQSQSVAMVDAIDNSALSVAFVLHPFHVSPYIVAMQRNTQK